MEFGDFGNIAELRVVHVWVAVQRLYDRLRRVLRHLQFLHANLRYCPLLRSSGCSQSIVNGVRRCAGPELNQYLAEDMRTRLLWLAKRRRGEESECDEPRAKEHCRNNRRSHQGSNHGNLLSTTSQHEGRPPI